MNPKLSVVISVILVSTSFMATPMLLRRQSASASVISSTSRNFNGGTQSTTSGNNVYLVWFSNKTGNWEVLFRASIDGGKPFGDKMNRSNTTSADPQVVANGNNSDMVGKNA